MSEFPRPLRICTPVPRPGSHPDYPVGDHVSLAEYAAMEPAKRWPNGSALTYALVGGESAARAEFHQAAATLAAIVNLTLTETPSDPKATFRVTFTQDGSSWSNVGQDCNLVPFGQATMNLGWPDDLARTIHELCHALGLMHNQAVRKTGPGGLNLDRQKCYAYFGGPPNNWSQSMVDSQVLYLFTDVFVGSGFDRASIMQYAVPDELTTDGNGIPWNQVLSQIDIRDLRAYYPKAAPLPPVAPPFVPPSVFTFPTKIDLSASPGPYAVGVPITITAVVKVDLPNNVAPNPGVGNVEFNQDNATTNKAVAVDSVGRAAYTFTPTTAGRHGVGVVYRGQAPYEPSDPGNPKGIGFDVIKGLTPVNPPVPPSPPVVAPIVSQSFQVIQAGAYTLSVPVTFPAPGLFLLTVAAETTAFRESAVAAEISLSPVFFPGTTIPTGDDHIMGNLAEVALNLVGWYNAHQATLAPAWTDLLLVLKPIVDKAHAVKLASAGHSADDSQAVV